MAYEFIGYKDIKSAMNRSILETHQRLYSASPMISRQRIVGKRLTENLNRKPMFFFNHFKPWFLPWFLPSISGFPVIFSVIR